MNEEAYLMRIKSALQKLRHIFTALMSIEP